MREFFLTLHFFRPPGPVVYVLDLADRLISKAGPFAAAGIMVGSIYWTAVTYGAVTVMQVRGFVMGLFCVSLSNHFSSKKLLKCEDQLVFETKMKSLLL